MSEPGRNDDGQIGHEPDMGGMGGQVGSVEDGNDVQSSSSAGGDYNPRSFRFSKKAQIALMKEVIAKNPFGAQHGNKRKTWEDIAASMRKLTHLHPGIDKICTRAVEDHTKGIMKKYRAGLSKMLWRRGTPEEYNELEALLQTAVKLQDAERQARLAGLPPGRGAAMLSGSDAPVATPMHHHSVDSRGSKELQPPHVGAADHLEVDVSQGGHGSDVGHIGVQQGHLTHDQGEQHHQDDPGRGPQQLEEHHHHHHHQQHAVHHAEQQFVPLPMSHPPISSASSVEPNEELAAKRVKLLEDQLKLEKERFEHQKMHDDMQLQMQTQRLEAEKQRAEELLQLERQRLEEERQLAAKEREQLMKRQLDLMNIMVDYFKGNGAKNPAVSLPSAADEAASSSDKH